MPQIEAAAPSLLIAGGGTGGHVLSGVAVAQAWKKRFPQAAVLFVGSQGGLEEKLVPRAGFDLQCLHIGALKGKRPVEKLKTLLQLPFALWFSVFILMRFKPAAVLGVGGYASGPVVLVARLLGWLWGARVAIMEQNAVPGFTNKVLGFFAHQVFTAFPGVERYFPTGKTTVTGNPVRAEMTPLPSASRDPFTLFIFGGSQGAVGINTLVLEALPLLKDVQAKLRFIHQTGEKDYARVVEGYQSTGVTGRIERFILDMPSCYREASLLVCRAGSGTLSEIAAVGRAAFLIPFPFATDNHQDKNAQVFVKAGAARVLDQNTAKGEDLARLIRDLIQNSSRLDIMEKAASTLHKPSAADTIVERLLAIYPIRI